MRATRRAVGDAVDIMVDLNQWWRMPGDISAALDAAAVRRLAGELADLGVLWLEEPLPARDTAGMRALREQTGIRVAGGEMARTSGELLDALAAGALDVIQPDVVLSGRPARARTVAEVAMLGNHWFTPHTWTNGLGLLANLHVAAGVGGGPYLEFPYDPPGWTQQRRDFFLASRCSSTPPVPAPCPPAGPWRRDRRGCGRAEGTMKVGFAIDLARTPACRRDRSLVEQICSGGRGHDRLTAAVSRPIRDLAHACRLPRQRRGRELPGILGGTGSDAAVVVTDAGLAATG